GHSSAHGPPFVTGHESNHPARCRAVSRTNHVNATRVLLHPAADHRSATRLGSRHSVPARAMNHVLSRLPWPLGQEAMALWGIARGVTSPVRRARAVQWAACHRTGSSARWRLALSLLANDGRFEAIHGLLGVRDAETLRATQIIEGEERLRSAVQAG